jgi:hypothetical protein
MRSEERMVYRTGKRTQNTTILALSVSGREGGREGG